MGSKVALIWAPVSVGGKAPREDGGASTLPQARRLAQGLESRGHQALVVQADEGLADILVREAPDVAIPLVQGDAALGGDLPFLLEALRIPFAGTSARMTRMAADRVNLQPALDLAALNGPSLVGTPATLALGAGAVALLGAVGTALVERRLPGGYPLCVKPALASPGFGIVRVDGPDELVAAMHAASRSGCPALVQEWVEGARLSVGILSVDGEPEALPCVGIADVQGAGETGAGTPACPVPPSLLSADPERAQEVRSQVERDALDAFYACGARDLAQVDLIWDGAVSRVLRVDTSPSLDRGSAIDMGAHAAGLDMADVAEQLLFTAVDRG